MSPKPPSMPGGGAALTEHFEALIDDLAGDGVAFERSQMFGSPGLRLPGKGKFFCCLVDEGLNVKLAEAAHAEALALEGAQVFEPMPGRPMKAWIVVPATHVGRWAALARAAAAALT